MTTHTRGFKTAFAAVTLGSALLLSGCNFGSLGSGSSSGSSGGSTTPAPPTTTVPGTDIGGGGNTSGSLALTQVTASTWSDQNGPIDIESFRIVPGDVLSYSAQYKITLTGAGMQARLTADPVTVTSGGQLAGKLQPQVTATIGGTVVPSGPAGTVLTTAQSDSVVDVVAKFTFDPQTSGAVGQSDSAHFSDVAIRLEQVLP